MDFIGAKDDGGGGDRQSSSQFVTTNKPTPAPSFIQVGCPSCRQANSIKALKGICVSVSVS